MLLQEVWVGNGSRRFGQILTTATKFMNIHASIANRCFYLYDSKSRREIAKCVPNPRLDVGNEEFRRAVLDMTSNISGPAWWSWLLALAVVPFLLLLVFA